MGEEDAKWNHELAVFHQALSCARARGGEARRNVDRLAGRCDHERESPDIVIERSDGSVVGLEHFRVDRLVRKDKKVRSAAKEYEVDLQRVRESLSPEVKKPCFSDEALGKFGKVAYEGMRLYARTGPNDLIRSLDARINGGSGHAQKLDAYRANLMSDYPHASSIELGYLIEVHADLTGMFLNKSGKVARVSPGQIPLFDELYDLLESASRRVDWIVIANYRSIGESMVDAFVFRCKDGLFGVSCKRQGLSRTVLLDPGIVSGIVDKGGGYAPEFERTGDEITYKVEKAFWIENPERYFKCVKGLAAKAVECNRLGIPFLTPIGVQMTYELVRGGLPQKGAGKLDERDVERALGRIPQDERDACLEAFEKRWFAEDDGRFSVNPGKMVRGLTPK